jgi:hypothetical protein
MTKKRQEGGLWREIVVGVALLVAGVLLGILTPTGEYWGRRILANWVTPDVRVSLSSVLVSRVRNDRIASVKIKYRIDNRDFYPRSIQPIRAYNDSTKDTIDLSSLPPVRVETQSFMDDSLLIKGGGKWLLFANIPCNKWSTWHLDFLVAGSREMLHAAADSSSLERLHFFLLPTQVLRVADPDVSQVQELYRVRTFGKLTDTLWQGKDTTTLLVYPADQLNIGIDTNLDGKQDTTRLVSQFVADRKGFACGNWLTLQPNLLYYFLEKRSGFAFGSSGSVLISDSLIMEWFCVHSQKDLLRVFGGDVDSDIPIDANSEFVYWKYDQYVN